MKRLGLIGGTTWQSTVVYYTRLNEIVSGRLGGSHSCKCLLYSLDFAPVEQNVKRDDKEANGDLFESAARALNAAGAEGLVLCANTAHLFADRVASAGLPLVHIGEATADAVKRSGLSRVGLLGTRYTMELDFIRGVVERCGIKVMIPEEADRAFIQHTILDEFGRGQYLDSTRTEYLRVIADLQRRGAEGVILGCTEIPILLPPGTLSVPSFDTTEIHVQAAAEFALS